MEDLLKCYVHINISFRFGWTLLRNGNYESTQLAGGGVAAGLHLDELLPRHLHRGAPGLPAGGAGAVQEVRPGQRAAGGRAENLNQSWKIVFSAFDSFFHLHTIKLKFENYRAQNCSDNPMYIIYIFAQIYF